MDQNAKLDQFDVEAFLADRSPPIEEALDPRDDTLFVQFFTETVVDEVQTRLQRRPVYVEREMIRICPPTSRDEVHDVLSDDYRRRFRRRYDLWKANQDAPINGTPLSQWPGISAINVKELEAMSIRSVEQLADSPATFLQKLGPIYVDLGARAKGYLMPAGDPVALEQAALEKSDLLAKNEALQSQLAAMQAMLEQATAPGVTETEQRKVKN